MSHMILDAFNKADVNTKALLCIALGNGLVVDNVLKCLDDEAKAKLYDAFYETIADNGGGMFGYSWPTINDGMKEWMWRLNGMQSKL